MQSYLYSKWFQVNELNLRIHDSSLDSLRWDILFWVNFYIQELAELLKEMIFIIIIFLYLLKKLFLTNLMTSLRIKRLEINGIVFFPFYWNRLWFFVFYRSRSNKTFASLTKTKLTKNRYDRQAYFLLNPKTPSDETTIEKTIVWINSLNL